MDTELSAYDRGFLEAGCANLAATDNMRRAFQAELHRERSLRRHAERLFWQAIAAAVAGWGTALAIGLRA